MIFAKVTVSFNWLIEVTEYARKLVQQSYPSFSRDRDLALKLCKRYYLFQLNSIKPGRVTTFLLTCPRIIKVKNPVGHGSADFETKNRLLTHQRFRKEFG